MTNIILTFAFVARSVFFAPLRMLDNDQMGRCQLIHYSHGMLRIPRCAAPGYEWAGAWREV